MTLTALTPAAWLLLPLAAAGLAAIAHGTWLTGQRLTHAIHRTRTRRDTP